MEMGDPFEPPLYGLVVRVKPHIIALAVSRQLAFSPMRFLARWFELAHFMPMQSRQDTDPCQHGRAAANSAEVRQDRMPQSRRCAPSL
jgi:hypothetical protein